MLDDTSRKLLRILAQFNYHFKRMPNVKELSRLSGRRPAQVLRAFKTLADANYIEWRAPAPVETARIIESWERNVPYDTGPARRTDDPGNVDYWLYY